VPPDPTPILAQLPAFTLVFARVTGLFVFTPVLTSGAVPVRFKALLAASFAAGVFAYAPPQAAVPAGITTPELAWLLFGELLIGAVIGMIAALPVLALEMAGAVIGYQMGLSMAQSYNPEMGSTSDAAGQLLFYVAVAALIATGGLERSFLLLCETFATMPPGGLFRGEGAAEPVGLLLAAVQGGSELALRVALPVVAIIALVMVAEAFVMRTMPQVNVMTIAFGAKAIVGIGMLVACLAATDAATMDELRSVFRMLEIWAVRG